MRRVTLALAAALLTLPLAALVDAALPVDDDLLRPLHVEGRTIRDDAGREVILRGTEVILKTPPYLPDATPEHFRTIRSWGMDSVRVGVIWAGVMPQEGVVDDAYLGRLGAIVDRAAAAGLYVVLDMHQNLYGVRWGTGAPEWSTDAAGCPHVPWSEWSGSWEADNFSPAVACAWTHFWTSERLQGRYAEAWKAVATAVGDRPNVVGYDLMNEPHPGTIPLPVFEQAYLWPSQARWLDAIRDADPDAVGFLEPSTQKNVGVPTTPGLLLPESVVYAPHLYGLWELNAHAWETTRAADAQFAYGALEAKAMGVPLWIGEFSANVAHPSRPEFVRHVYDLADAEKAGLVYWWFDPLAADVAAGDTTLLREVARAYPRAMVGDVTSFAYDADARTLTVRWTQGEAGESLVSAPSVLYPSGVTVEGVDEVAHDHARGLVVVRTAAGSHELTVRPAGA